MAEQPFTEGARHRIRRRWRNNERRIAMYHEMLSLAVRCGDPFETDRIAEAITELEDARDDIITWADRAGMGPDELDSLPTAGPWPCQDDQTDRGGEG